MQEIWLPITGFEGLYEVSNLGNVRRLWKTHTSLLKQFQIKGYLRVSLCKDSIQYWFLVHRLVGQAFIPNPKSYPFINHKDEVKTNNRVENLEWCTRLYNNNYGNRTAKTSKPVEAFDDNGTIIYSFKSLRDARRHGFSDCEINRVISNKQPLHKGLHWRYSSNA